jgi:hypothetical protein
MSFLGTLRNWWTGSNAAQPWVIDGDRFTRYNRHQRAYNGYAIRGTIGTSTVTAQRRLRFNLNRTIVDLGAQFLGAAPVNWQVDGDKDAEAAAADIWTRSGSDRLMLEGARSAGILGEIAGIATQDDEGRSRIEFVTADIAHPFFDGADYQQLRALEIRFRRESWEAFGEAAPREIEHREEFTESGVRIFEDNVEVDSRPTDGIPAVWIRNRAVMGQPWGLSDLEDVTALVEEYDHVASKRTRIIDYYGSPHIIFEGVTKGTSDTVEIGIGTIHFIPAGSKAYFLDWGGNQPDFETHLGRIRDSLSEISQVPAIAFGDADRTGAQISGVALRVLYGPLLAKTRDKQAQWGPALEHLMALCLRAEGHREINADRVHVHWQDPLPANVKELVEGEVAKVTNDLSSVRSSMQRLGVEDVNGELRKMLVERRIKAIVSPPAVPPGMPPQGGEPPMLQEGAPDGQETASGPPQVIPPAEAPETPDDLSAESLAELERQFNEMEAFLMLEDEREKAEEEAREGA